MNSTQKLTVHRNTIMLQRNSPLLFTTNKLNGA